MSPSMAEGSDMDPQSTMAAKRKRDAHDKGQSAERKRRKKKDKNKPTAPATSPVCTAADSVPHEANGLIPVQQSPEPTSLPSWKVLDPMGGRMADVDPIITPDEQYLLLAYTTSLQVYGIADSLLVRRIPLSLPSQAKSSSGYVVSAYLSPSSPSICWICSSNGWVWKIDWATGDGSEACLQTVTQCAVDMAVASLNTGHNMRDLLLVSEGGSGNKSSIMAYDGTKPSIMTAKRLMAVDKPIRMLRLVDGGLSLVGIVGNSRVIVGAPTTPAPSGIKEFDYTFYGFNANDYICSLDIRSSEAPDTRHLEGDKYDAAVDVVLGAARGSIFVFRDILAKLRLIEESHQDRKHIQPQKYHWHRRAVHSVKWSRDGHYIISGGYETTLVLYQSDTGRLDFLPHLSASIENIVVSPSGSSYGVHLDDNSIIVLSTAEMRPTAYVSGIQSLVLDNRPPKDPIKRVSMPDQSLVSTVVASMNPLQPTQMLLCVGNGQKASISGGSNSTALLQTFDVSSFQSLSKQALTRTFPTEANISSKGQPLVEPNVTHICFSGDGKWLASVDEWVPPVRAPDFADEVEEVICQHREVYLRFWGANGEEPAMPLVSRVNAPHSANGAEEIFDLTSDPKITRFATLGGDSVVRIWSPRLRQHDGIAVKNNKGQQLYNWVCSQSIPLGDCRILEMEDELEDTDFSSLSEKSGALCFSEDGSALFVALGSQYQSAVYVIDTESWEVRGALDGLFNGEIRGIRILSPYLVTLSDDLRVYDLVRDELRYGLLLARKNMPDRGMHLAVDHESKNLAVAVPRVEASSQNIYSEIAVFSPQDLNPLLTQKLPQMVTSLLTTAGSAGFIALDANAQVWSIVEGTDATPLNIARPLSDIKLDRQLQNGDSVMITNGDERSDDEEDEDLDMDADDEDEGYAVVIPREKLGDIFNAAPAFAMPSIYDVFSQVTDLLSVGTSGLHID